MEIHSLVRKTDLIFNRFQGEVKDHGDFIVVKTPSNPSFHWGNYILFSKAPKEGDLEKWQSLFKKEFSSVPLIRHFSFCWDTATETRGATQSFTDSGYTLEQNIGLTTTKLILPEKKRPSGLHIKKIKTSEEWEEVIALQKLNRLPRYNPKSFEEFTQKQFENYKKMSESGCGEWFGAYIENKLVGDVGLFFNEDLGRFQRVETHPQFRRLGICQALLYEAGQTVRAEFGSRLLVIEADGTSFTPQAYESVGFQSTEKSFTLSLSTP